MTVGKSNAREIGDSDLCMTEVSNGDRSPNGRVEEDDGDDAVGEPCPGPVGDDELKAVAQLVIYCTLTP